MAFLAIFWLLNSVLILFSTALLAFKFGVQTREVPTLIHLMADQTLCWCCRSWECRRVSMSEAAPVVVVWDFDSTIVDANTGE
jgi:hypothetical protein